MSKKIRIAVVVSIIYPLVVMFLRPPWKYAIYGEGWEIFFFMGVLPILLYWSFRFIKYGKSGALEDQK